jgi:Na+-driven multidrug efflux pump
MILFTILLIVLAVLAVILLVSTGVIGAAAAIVFGDLIVFGIIMWAIIRRLFKKKR